MDEFNLEQENLEQFDAIVQGEKVEGTTFILLSAEEYERTKSEMGDCSLIPCNESDVRILRVNDEPQKIDSNE